MSMGQELRGVKEYMGQGNVYVDDEVDTGRWVICAGSDGGPDIVQIDAVQLVAALRREYPCILRKANVGVLPKERARRDGEINKTIRAFIRDMDRLL